MKSLLHLAIAFPIITSSVAHEKNTMPNVLLQSHVLPPFSAIDIADVEPAVDHYLQQNKDLLAQKLKQSDFTWDNLIAPCEELDDQLNQAWSPVSHLHAVKNSDALRKVYQSCVAKLSAYHTEVGQNKALYQAYQQIASRADFQALTQAQQKTIQDGLQAFELSGVGLDADKQKRFKAIQARLAELSMTFDNHVMDATEAWHYDVTEEAELSGLPGHIVGLAKEKASLRGSDSDRSNLAQGLDSRLRGKDTMGDPPVKPEVDMNKKSIAKIGIDPPTYIAVMTYADDRALRERVYRAYGTRACAGSEFDNTAVIDEILSLRHEMAGLLGFDNYAELSIQTKMAESTQAVTDFLWQLVNKAKPAAERELAELKNFAQTAGLTDALKPWDVAYYAEKMSEQQFAISQEQLRPYFPVENVMQGLFRVIYELYGLSVTEKQGVDVWDPSVKFYEIHDDQGELRGSLYVDLYARDKKRGGAWMDECRVRFKHQDGTVQKPVAYLNCNFARPVDGQSACMTHHDMVTLFHECGHCLHHVLTQIDVPAVSGINGVEWDAVELPSQLMENFCWEPKVLAFLAKHIETGESLPVDLMDRLKASRHFQAGLRLVRQLEFALFDFVLHQDYSESEPQSVQAMLAHIRDQVAVINPPKENCFQNSFSHIFAGGYAAGYYSYLWAEVLSADVFSAFAKKGVLSREVGEQFLQKLLSRGGSAPMSILFKYFLGRLPSVDVLLQQYQLA